VLWRSLRQGYRVPGMATLGTHGRIVAVVDLTRLADVRQLYLELKRSHPNLHPQWVQVRWKSSHTGGIFWVHHDSWERLRGCKVALNDSR